MKKATLNVGRAPLSAPLKVQAFRALAQEFCESLLRILTEPRTVQEYAKWRLDNTHLVLGDDFTTTRAGSYFAGVVTNLRAEHHFLFNRIFLVCVVTRRFVFCVVTNLRPEHHFLFTHVFLVCVF